MRGPNIAGEDRQGSETRAAGKDKPGRPTPIPVTKTPAHARRQRIVIQPLQKLRIATLLQNVKPQQIGAARNGFLNPRPASVLFACTALKRAGIRDRVNGRLRFAAAPDQPYPEPQPPKKRPKRPPLRVSYVSARFSCATTRPRRIQRHHIAQHPVRGCA